MYERNGMDILLIDRYKNILVLVDYFNANDCSPFEFCTCKTFNFHSGRKCCTSQQNNRPNLTFYIKSEQINFIPLWGVIWSNHGLSIFFKEIHCWYNLYAFNAFTTIWGNRNCSACKLDLIINIFLDQS